MSLPLLDTQTLETLRGFGSSDFLERMIELFLESSVRTIEEARAAAEDGNLARSAFAAHAMRSSAATLGLPRLTDAAKEMEQFQWTDNGTLIQRLEILETTYKATVVELISFRDAYRDGSRPA
ncbi:MAG: Hpt domain-containing protein [Fibrobacteria bacterium]|nr:Hpt domain-containing protein [Fibrobacteria bacterium]